MNNEEPVTYVDYRGYHVAVYVDDYSQSFYSIIDGEEYCHGTYNTEYEEEIHYILDDKLDTIYRFDSPYHGAILRWFDNGGIRDIKLTYRSRILKIFLTPANYELTELEKNKIIDLSCSILQRLVKTDTGKYTSENFSVI